MNPWTWLENHPNAALVAVIGGSVAFAAVIGWLFHWYVLDWRYWFRREGQEREAEGPGTRPLRVAGSSGWRGQFDSGSPLLRLDDEWEPEPYTDADADRLIADLTTDLPGPDMPAWAGKHHERLPLVDALTDDPDLLQWDIDCQVARIREIRGELAALKLALVAA